MKAFKRKRNLRRGATVVEMACVAPLLLLMMLGCIELGYAFMLKQTVNLAANRGARQALLPGATMADVQAAVDEAMGTSRQIDYITESNIDALGPNDPEVWVSVTIPLDRATFTGKMLGGGGFDIGARRTVQREGVQAIVAP